MDGWMDGVLFGLLGGLFVLVSSLGFVLFWFVVVVVVLLLLGWIALVLLLAVNTPSSLSLSRLSREVFF